MTTYQIELSYHDNTKSLKFETYRRISSTSPYAALERIIKKFHHDRKPLQFKIHRIVITEDTETFITYQTST